MRHSIQLGFGIAVGRVLFRLVSFLLGWVVLASLGLMMIGKPGSGLAILLPGFLVYYGLKMFIMRRGR